jgi:hypothetical protein
MFSLSWAVLPAGKNNTKDIPNNELDWIIAGGHPVALNLHKSGLFGCIIIHKQNEGENYERQLWHVADGFAAAH